MHIGLIGGIGPAATTYYYRGLTRRAAQNGHRLELTIAHAHMPVLGDNMARGRPEITAAMYADLGGRLKAAGAECLAITSMGGHYCIAEFEPMSPLPIISGIDAVVSRLTDLDCGRIGLLGTTIVMNSHLYGGLSALDVVVPQGSDLALAGDTYTAMATAAEVTDTQRETLFSIGRDLCTGQGADVVVLAGTDLFLAFEGQDCGFPVIDSADLHIDAIFDVACQHS